MKSDILGAILFLAGMLVMSAGALAFGFLVMLASVFTERREHEW